MAERFEMRTWSQSTEGSQQLQNGIGKTAVTLDSKANARLVRKYDIWLLPTLILMCLFQAVDKALIGIAKIDGIETDLGLTQTQYNVAISIFQVGYRLVMIPSNLIVTRVRPSISLPMCCLAWSIVAACHVLVHDYTGLLVVRILLGICDAPFWIGATHVLSSWYTKSELVSRVSIMLAALLIAFVAITPISAGMMESHEGRINWLGWRWLYLIFGLSGFLPATFGMLTLPDYPHSPARRFWLSESEQELAKTRMNQDRIAEGTIKRQNIWGGLKDAVKDIRTWIFVLMFVFRNSFEGLLYYLPAIVKSYNLFPDSHLSRNTVTLLLSSPPALLAAALALILAWSSNRRKERTFHLVLPLLVAFFALVFTATRDPKTWFTIVKYVCMYFYLAGTVSTSGLAWSWVPNVIQETPEKKACAIAIVSVFGGLGAVWSPFLFRAQDYPGYHVAFAMLAVFAALEMLCCFWMRSILEKRNKDLRATERNVGAAVHVEHTQLHVL